MIADTAMAIFELAPVDPHWYRDRAAVRRALDAILDTPLGALVHYAGIIREAKKAPDRAAVHALVATGQDHIFALQEAKKPTRMTMVLSIVEGNLAVDARVYAPEMAERPTAIDDLAAAGIALRNCDVFLGMCFGFVRPHIQSWGSYDITRTKRHAPTDHSNLRSFGILDLIDVRFNASNKPRADRAEVRLAKSKVPSWVERTEKDGLLRLDWVRSFDDKRALDRACEAHEEWVERNLPTS